MWPCGEVKMADSSETSAASVVSVDPVCVDSDQEPDAVPPTFLSRLRAADPADISRPRKLKN